MHELAYFDEVGFDDVKISVKASNVPLMIEAYRLLSETTDHPLHLGVTEAGPPPAGLVKSTAGIATLLAEGIGDTIRYSLTADPVEEARAGRQLLEALGLRERKGLDLIACPSCGRAEVDVIRRRQPRRRPRSSDRNIPLQVAVMGCVVNGPGEAREADLGIAAGQRARATCSSRGHVVRVVPEDDMVAALVEEAERILAEGIEARIAAADAGAEAIAAATRAELLAEQGVDANDDESRIELVRNAADGVARANATRAQSAGRRQGRRGRGAAVPELLGHHPLLHDAQHHVLDRGDDDRDVERERPVLDVEDVEALVRVERRVVAGLDLPQAGDARRHRLAGEQILVELGDLRRQRRPRADEAHLAAQHVEQVRQLVDARGLEEAADPRAPRVLARA